MKSINPYTNEINLLASRNEVNQYSSQSFGSSEVIAPTSR